MHVSIKELQKNSISVELEGCARYYRYLITTIEGHRGQEEETNIKQWKPLVYDKDQKHIQEEIKDMEMD